MKAYSQEAIEFRNGIYRRLNQVMVEPKHATYVSRMTHLNRQAVKNMAAGPGENRFLHRGPPVVNAYLVATALEVNPAWLWFGPSWGKGPDDDYTK